VKFDPGFVIHCVFDNTQQALVRALADNHGLADEFVTTEISWRRHASTSVSVRGIECRIDTTEIRALCLRASTLRSHGDDIRAADDEDTLVVNLLAVPDEQRASVDVDDLALTAFTAEFFHVIVLPDLRSVTIGRDSMFIPTNDLRYLSV
jgi:hypothetical protein